MDHHGSSPDISITLSTLDGSVPAVASELEFETVRKWAENYLSSAHPDLGRKGPVCPYTSTSIAKGLFRVAFIRGANLDHDRVLRLLDHIADAFLLPDSADSVYKAVVIVFPDVKAYDQIEALLLERMESFARSGLMVGQFCPGHEVGGIWNPDFRPFDAPYPMLAARNMLAADFLFVRASSECMSAYLARFAPAIPSQFRTEIVSSITA